MPCGFINIDSRTRDKREKNNGREVDFVAKVFRVSGTDM